MSSMGSVSSIYAHIAAEQAVYMGLDGDFHNWTAQAVGIAMPCRTFFTTA
jgi:hypothetical protein